MFHDNRLPSLALHDLLHAVKTARLLVPCCTHHLVGVSHVPWTSLLCQSHLRVCSSGCLISLWHHAKYEAVKLNPAICNVTVFVFLVLQNLALVGLAWFFCHVPLQFLLVISQHWFLLKICLCIPESRWRWPAVPSESCLRLTKMRTVPHKVFAAMGPDGSLLFLIAMTIMQADVYISVCCVLSIGCRWGDHQI